MSPTPLLINCLTLIYNVDKVWLTDDANEDLSALNSVKNMASLIAEQYDRLDEKYKRFIENQILQLLEMQGDGKNEQNGGVQESRSSER